MYKANFWWNVDSHDDLGLFYIDKGKRHSHQQIANDIYWESLQNDNFPPPETNSVADPDLLDDQPILDWLEIRWPNASAAIRRDLLDSARHLIAARLKNPKQRITLNNCGNFLPFSQMRSRLCFALLQQMYRPRTGATRVDRASSTKIPAICEKIREMQSQSLSDVKTIRHAREWLDKVECPYRTSSDATFKARIYLATQCPCCGKDGWKVALTAKNLKEHEFRIQCFNTNCKLRNLKTKTYRPSIGSDGLRIFYAISVGQSP